MEKEKALGVIPVRFDSVRFPGKPLAMIQGKTLIQRTYEAAKRSKELERIIVATDDVRIFQHVQEFGGEAAMTSKECPTGTDRLNDLLTRQKELGKYPIVVNIQGDEPCLSSNILDTLINLLREDKEAVAATAATRLYSKEEAENPSVVKCVFDKHQNSIYFSRALIPAARDLDYNPVTAYYRHIGIYAYRKFFLPIYASLPPTELQLAEDLEQLKILENGYRMKIAVVDYQGHDVNLPEDIPKVEKFLKEQGG